ncbi:MAG: TatD family hydrolase [Bacteroidia bacterium]|nr:TatD family hydrolase [Bacteroidia bacterium]
MNLIDTHSHIYLDDFSKDTPETIRRAIESGLSKIFLPNIDSGSIKALNTLALTYPGTCFPMMGLHPTSVKDNYEEELRIVDKELEKGRYYGIGETGIDLYWDKTFKEQQIISFRHHFELALKYDLPVIIHCRNSFDEVLAVVTEFKDCGIRGIFHAFSGNAEQAEAVIKLGYLVGIGGVVTYKNSGLAEVVKIIGLDSMSLETDAPFLPPVPKRGMRNEPSFLIYTANKVAESLGVSIETVAIKTTGNAERLFRI